MELAEEVVSHVLHANRAVEHPFPRDLHPVGHRASTHPSSSPVSAITASFSRLLFSMASSVISTDGHGLGAERIDPRLGGRRVGVGDGRLERDVILLEPVGVALGPRLLGVARGVGLRRVEPLELGIRLGPAGALLLPDRLDERPGGRRPLVEPRLQRLGHVGVQRHVLLGRLLRGVDDLLVGVLGRRWCRRRTPT